MLLVAFLVFFSVKLIPAPQTNPTVERDTQKAVKPNAVEPDLLEGTTGPFNKTLTYANEDAKKLLVKLYDRLDVAQKGVVEIYPSVLPAMLVAPTETTEAVNAQGNYAVSYIMRHTPDCYGEAAKVVRDNGTKMLEIKSILNKHTSDLHVDTAITDGFITYLMTKKLDITSWLERRFGLEQAIYLLSTNAAVLDAYETTLGQAGLNGVLYSLQGYAGSGMSKYRNIAEISCAVPGGLPLFFELQSNPTKRDEYIAKYGKTGGITVLSQFSKKLWEDLITSVEKYGESALVIMAVLSENPDFKSLLDKVKSSDVTHTISDVIHVLMGAMQADGLDAPRKMMVERTMRQIQDGNWNDIPEDYLTKDTSLIWSLLPGKDAFHLVKLLMHGYSPTLIEMTSGAWDAMNLVKFVVSVGSGVVDCTSGVSSAMGDQSFTGLAKALGVVAQDALSGVLSRVMESLSEPRNYTRLAVSAGYFAYDAVLRYAPFEIPNRAELLELNQKFFAETAQGMLVDLLTELGATALWRPEFDHKDLVIPEPDMAELGKLDSAGKMVLELKRMDARVKNAVMELLSSQEQRKRLLKMLGMFNEPEEKKGEVGPQHLPQTPSQPKSEHKNWDEEDMSYTEPIGYFVSADGKKRPMQLNSMRQIKNGEYTIRSTGKHIVVDSANFESLVHDPSFTIMCLDQIVEIAVNQH